MADIILLAVRTYSIQNLKLLVLHLSLEEDSQAANTLNMSLILNLSQKCNGGKT